MTAIIACWTLGAIAFFLSAISVSFSLVFNKEELFGKYKHWTRPLLFLAGIAWFVLMMVVTMGTKIES